MNKDIKELISKFSLKELEELGNFAQELCKAKRREIEHQAFEKFKNAFLEFRKILPHFDAYVEIENSDGDEFEIDLMEALDDYMSRR